MHDQTTYLHQVDYLHNLIIVKKLSGSDIRDLVLKMMQRLCETKSKHYWSTAPEVFPILIGKFNIYYSMRIYFATEEDMLMFRLIWGIHT
jgi:hypothetical protein